MVNALRMSCLGVVMAALLCSGLVVGLLSLVPQFCIDAAPDDLRVRSAEGGRTPARSTRIRRTVVQIRCLRHWLMQIR